MSVTLEQQLAHRPINPMELEEAVQDVQRQVRAYRLRMETLGGRLNVEAAFGDTRYVITG